MQFLLFTFSFTCHPSLSSPNLSTFLFLFRSAHSFFLCLDFAIYVYFSLFIPQLFFFPHFFAYFPFTLITRLSQSASFSRSPPLPSPPVQFFLLFTRFFLPIFSTFFTPLLVSLIYILSFSFSITHTFTPIPSSLTLFLTFSCYISPLFPVTFLDLLPCSPFSHFFIPPDFPLLVPPTLSCITSLLYFPNQHLFFPPLFRRLIPLPYFTTYRSLSSFFPSSFLTNFLTFFSITSLCSNIIIYLLFLSLLSFPV